MSSRPKLGKDARDQAQDGQHVEFYEGKEGEMEKVKFLLSLKFCLDWSHYVVYMNVFPVCVSVHYTCAWFLHVWEETIGSPGTGDADGCKLPCESEARGTRALSHWVNPLGPYLVFTVAFSREGPHSSWSAWLWESDVDLGFSPRSWTRWDTGSYGRV